MGAGRGHLPAQVDDFLAHLAGEYQGCQYLALGILHDAWRRGLRSLAIVHVEPSSAAVAVAFAGMLLMTELSSRLLGVPLRLPSVTVQVASSAPKPEVEALLAQAFDEHGIPIGTDTPSTSVRVVRSRAVAGPADYTVTGEQVDVRTGITADRRPVRMLSRPIEQLVQEPRGPASWPVHHGRDVLDVVARRYFPVPELREQ